MMEAKPAHVILHWLCRLVILNEVYLKGLEPPLYQWVGQSPPVAKQRLPLCYALPSNRLRLGAVRPEGRINYIHCVNSGITSEYWEPPFCYFFWPSWCNCHICSKIYEQEKWPISSAQRVSIRYYLFGSWKIIQMDTPRCPYMGDKIP